MKKIAIIFCFLAGMGLNSPAALANYCMVEYGLPEANLPTETNTSGTITEIDNIGNNQAYFTLVLDDGPVMYSQESVDVSSINIGTIVDVDHIPEEGFWIVTLYNIIVIMKTSKPAY